jgi:Domain of unknown function (DUF4262)
LPGFDHTFETPTVLAGDGSGPFRGTRRKSPHSHVFSPSTRTIIFAVNRINNRRSRAANRAKPQRTGSDLGERKILADINEFGWSAVNGVEDDGHPPWTFTIGLYETWSHPELIVIGRSRATAHNILTTLVDKIEDGRPPELTHPGPYLLLGE